MSWQIYDWDSLYFVEFADPDMDHVTFIGIKKAWYDSVDFLDNHRKQEVNC